MKPFTHGKDPRKMEWGPLTSVLMVAFMDSFCYQLIYPNLAFMIKDFFPGINDTDIGYYSGVLTAAYSLGGIPGSLFWGWFADRYGRRKCFLISLICIFICMNAFGLTMNFYGSVAIRVIWGFANGILGATKTYISEICTDHTQAFGFALFSAIGGVAGVFGPVLGGLLAKPERNFPGIAIAIPFLREYPYYLPCFVGGIVNILVIFLVIFCLPETLTDEEIKKNNENKLLTQKSIKEVLDKKKNDSKYQLTEEEIELELWSQDNYWTIGVNKVVVVSCLLYLLISFAQAAQDALFPLFLLNPKDILIIYILYNVIILLIHFLQYFNHGFEFDQTDIGYVFSGTVIAQALCSPLLLPLLQKFLSYRHTYLIFMIIYGFCNLLTPLLGLLSYENKTIQWFWCNFYFSFSYAIRILAFAYPLYFFEYVFLNNYTGCMVLISNSIFSNFRSKVNGLGQVYASVGRFLGPLIFTSLFAWSTSSGNSFPFDYGFVFYLLFFVCIFSGFLALYIPKHVNDLPPTVHEYAKHLYSIQHDIELNNVNISEKKEIASDDKEDVNKVINKVNQDSNEKITPS
ncbi:hypothetical protein WA158_001185 [Blastocystis sp. Blastoise]